MTGRFSILNPITIPVLATLLTYVYTFYLHRTVLVLGIFRRPDTTVVPPNDFVVIEGTAHCEDLHYYEPSNLIFTACEASVGTRFSWFPPHAHFRDPVPTSGKGSIQIIDPVDLKTRSLVLEGFDDPFTTHGIDVIADPERPGGEAVYIFAVNHKRNPEHYGENGDAKAPKSHSVVELFHHIIGSDTARHIRTVWDPLMTTPNDVLGLSPNSFFVTNDHYYTEGFMRLVEDAHFGARWTNVINVEFPGATSAENDTCGVKASVALDKLHNSNGLGHGRTPSEALVTSCVSALLHIGEIGDDGSDGSPNIKVKQVVEFDSSIDNPSYFSDPYANDTLDASGFVVCGLTRPIEFLEKKEKREALEPVVVYKASPAQKSGSNNGQQDWETRVIFQDDGRRIRTASSAVLIAIDPKQEEGKRRAWLFVSGYMSSNVIAVKIDL